MKLYMVPLAPNPVKVMLYIAERAARGVEMNIETVIVNTLKGKHKAQEHLARNPFGTLPVLELESGRFIIESRVIIDFLEAQFPAQTLFSTNPEQRAFEQDVERVCDVRLAAYLGNWVHCVKSPLGFPADPERAALLEAQMQPAFDYLEQLLGDGRPFLCGDRPTPADCTLQAFFNFMRFTGRSLIEQHALLRAWDQHYRSRDVVSSVIGN